MTFDEWMKLQPWVPSEMSDPVYQAYRAHLANCWNAALNAAAIQMDRIERQVRETQDPPVTDLATWIMFYRSRFARALQLIQAKNAPPKHKNS